MCSLLWQGKTDAEIAKFSKLFTEVQQQIDSKQLRPMIRTQYLRTAFQVRAHAWLPRHHMMEPVWMPGCLASRAAQEYACSCVPACCKDPEV